MSEVGKTPLRKGAFTVKAITDRSDCRRVTAAARPLEFPEVPHA